MVSRPGGIRLPWALQPCWVSADALASRFIRKAFPWALPPQGLQALPHPLASLDRGIQRLYPFFSQLQSSLHLQYPFHQASAKLLQPTQGLGVATGALPPQIPGPHLLGSGWSG